MVQHKEVQALAGLDEPLGIQAKPSPCSLARTVRKSGPTPSVHAVGTARARLLVLGAHDLVGHQSGEPPDRLLHVGRVVLEPGQGPGANCAVSGVSGRPCTAVIVLSSNPICRHLRF